MDCIADCRIEVYVLFGRPGGGTGGGLLTPNLDVLCMKSCTWMAARFFTDWHLVNTDLCWALGRNCNFVLKFGILWDVTPCLIVTGVTNDHSAFVVSVK